MVFVDPPYVMSTNCGVGSKIGRLMNLLETQVNKGGIVTLRTHLRSYVEDTYGRLVRIDQREWGNMKITFFQNPEDPEQ